MSVIRCLSTLLALVLLVAILSSCGVLDSNDSSGENQSIEGTLSFNIYEGWSDSSIASDPEIFLFMATKTVYPCVNYSIVADINISDTTVSVNLHHIFCPDICATTMGYAKLKEALLIEPGSYELVFTYKDVTDVYALTISDSLIHVEGPVGELTTLFEELNWRIPPQSFSCTCYASDEYFDFARAFMDSLQTRDSLIEFTFPDMGMIPYPGVWSWKSDRYGAVRRYFQYTSEIEYELVIESATRYIDEDLAADSDVNIALINWRNERYRH